ncbi:MAG TPA: (2Fe-2S)-binding protein [Bacilli bacterium]|nr:(2Fe-2S)-binding protein [Bacilli bacterium]
MTLPVNGDRHPITVRGADTLLRVLREHLGLTGAKPGCENGDCGACTVLLDGTPNHSCLLLAVECAERQVTTVEGLGDAPIQRAFVDRYAFQCGYCTSGFLVKAHALVTTHPNADDLVIREWLQSNVCRCTCYQEIEEAVKGVLGGEYG